MKKQKEITKRRLRWNFTRLVNIFNEKVEQELIDENIGKQYKLLLEYIQVEITFICKDFNEKQADNTLKLLIKAKQMLLGTWRIENES